MNNALAMKMLKCHESLQCTVPYIHRHIHISKHPSIHTHTYVHTYTHTCMYPSIHTSLQFRTLSFSFYNLKPSVLPRRVSLSLCPTDRPRGSSRCLYLRFPPSLPSGLSSHHSTRGFALATQFVGELAPRDVVWLPCLGLLLLLPCLSHLLCSALHSVAMAEDALAVEQIN